MGFDEVIKAIADLSHKGEPFAVGTVIETEGSTPAKVGAKIVVTCSGRMAGTVGGGRVENEFIKDAQADLLEGKSKIHSYSLGSCDLTGGSSLDDVKPLDSFCGGYMRIFVEVAASHGRRLVIFGGGHVSLPLARMAALLGFRTTIIDSRPEFANRERFPDSEIICDDFVNVSKTIEFTKDSIIVIMTPDHTFDLDVLENVARRGKQAAYIGMIGSRKKVKTVFNILKDRGVPVADLARVRTPIGLDLGAVTPEEIALSIISEIIMSEKGGTGLPMSAVNEKIFEE